MIQHPDRSPKVILIFKSDRQGAGKSTLGAALCRMVGAKHSASFLTPDMLLGEFNDHLAPLLFIQLEEMAFAGNHEKSRQLKAMSTMDVIAINKKYRSVYYIPNIMHIIMFTNEDWAIDAGNNSRRFFIHDIDDEKARDPEYFNQIYWEMDNGGIEAMLYSLNQIDLTGWDPLRDMPRTEELILQQLMSAKPWVKWAVNVADENDLGMLAPVGAATGGWMAYYQTKRIANAIQRYNPRAFEREPLSLAVIGRWLAKCKLAPRTVNGTAEWWIPDAATFKQLVLDAAGITR